jgi:two-component system LytT family response regulator
LVAAADLHVLRATSVRAGFTAGRLFFPMNIPNENFRVAIIDDSQRARESIEAQLRDDPEVQVVAQCAGGSQAAEAVLRHRPDILFLEARLRDAATSDLLGNLPAIVRPKVVLITAREGFALRASENQAVDCLLKPFSRVRLGAALERAKTAVRRDPLQAISRQLNSIWLALQVVRPPAPEAVPAPPVAPAPAEPPAKVREERGRIFIRSGRAIHLVAADDIRWIQTDGDYLRLHTADKSHMVRMPLSRMMHKLDPAQFVRIHRSTAVNLRHMSRATPARFGEYTVDLANGTKLKVSRTFVRSLKSRL